MGAFTPVTDEERERIRELHAQGLGRNEIARTIGRGTRTVSIQAAAMGLTFANADDDRGRHPRTQSPARRTPHGPRRGPPGRGRAAHRADAGAREDLQLRRQGQHVRLRRRTRAAGRREEGPHGSGRRGGRR
nr:helix-turn-helix domain-containing protein [Streptomyces sp. NBC_00899]